MQYKRHANVVQSVNMLVVYADLQCCLGAICKLDQPTLLELGVRHMATVLHASSSVLHHLL
jgi:hypothetical protein